MIQQQVVVQFSLQHQAGVNRNDPEAPPELVKKNVA